MEMIVGQSFLQLFIIIYLIPSNFLLSIPSFVHSHTNVSIYTQEGATVIIPCLVEYLRPETHVIWIKKSFKGKSYPQTLTVGMNQFNYDWRISVIHRKANNNYQYHSNKLKTHRLQRRQFRGVDNDTRILNMYDIPKTHKRPDAVEYWNLQLHDLNLSDSGIYQCQISSSPTSFKKDFFLYVVPKYSKKLKDNYSNDNNLNRRRHILPKENKLNQFSSINDKRRLLLRKDHQQKFMRLRTYNNSANIKFNCCIVLFLLVISLR
ncbi:hypothetical protein SNEBB_002560 [Seison nebaliae]|nr:hypothetical protein SNEBB_002560 [Seison nebaliae]